MEDYLARCFAVVGVDVQSVCTNRIADRRCDFPYSAHHCCERFVVGIEYVLYRLLWNDERVARTHWRYIQERQCVVVFVHYFRRDLTADDLHEYGVFHMRA